MQKNYDKSINSFLFENLDILSNFNFLYSNNISFNPIKKKYIETDENGNPIYSIESDSTLGIRDIDKFHPIPLDSDSNVMSIGIDASSIPSYCLTRGNTRYLIVKPYIICARGENSHFILEEMSEIVKYMILISSKLNIFSEKCQRAIYPHYKMQNNLVNVLKHVKEGKIFADFIDKIVNIAIEYGYHYNSNQKDEQNLIILKDGSILSNSEIKLSRALHSGKTKGIESYLKLYNSIKRAGESGIPIVGIVKDSQSLLLSRLFAPFGSDYHIIRNLAKCQNVIYSYLSPIKKIIEPYRNIEIDNYFTYIEKNISPLRLEVIPEFKPKSVNFIHEIIEKTIQLIYQNNNIHEFNNKLYKLPFCILNSDITSRNIAKYSNELIKEKLYSVRRRLPIPMVVKRGFE